MTVQGVEERGYDVVADVVVAERGELLANGVDGDARGVAAHRYAGGGRASRASRRVRCAAKTRAREEMWGAESKKRNGHAAAFVSQTVTRNYQMKNVRFKHKCVLLS